MNSSEIFDNDAENQWCPGCGNFPILKAMKKAFAKSSLAPRDLLVVSGIGQAGKAPHFFQCNMIHGLHGRALPLATGAKIANKDLNIVVSTGDGDCYGEGGNHFLAAVRRNIDLTLLVHNNRVYGLTKGQASPTSAYGMKTAIQQSGTRTKPFNALSTSLVAGVGFVAQGFAGDVDHLTGLIEKALAYKGFSLLDILQPCVSFNKVNTFEWYKERVQVFTEENHDAADFNKALELAQWDEEENGIPIGILYKSDAQPFHERIEVLKNNNLLDATIDQEKLKQLV
jgi:2-oxoglutarate ferredoxin oxidoreductase subunit beta